MIRVTPLMVRVARAYLAGHGSKDASRIAGGPPYFSSTSIRANLQRIRAFTGLHSSQDACRELLSTPTWMTQADWAKRHVEHWERTGHCLRHLSLDDPPLFCEQCGKAWSLVIDGREGRKRRRAQAA